MLNLLSAAAISFFRFKFFFVRGDISSIKNRFFSVETICQIRKLSLVTFQVSLQQQVRSHIPIFFLVLSGYSFPQKLPLAPFLSRKKRHQAEFETDSTVLFLGSHLNRRLKQSYKSRTYHHPSLNRPNTLCRLINFVDFLKKVTELS